jgi:hypothetical protein
VWVPQGQLDRVTRDLRPGVLISSKLSGSSLANSVLDRHSREGDGPVLAAYRRRLTEYLDMLARLSCVDGALVIDDCIAPYGFSVHLASQKWTDAVVEGPVGTFLPGQAIDLEGFGTRHNSAINFAGAHPGTSVFVVSEDGPVRTICRLEKSVLIWPDCLNTVFLDWQPVQSWPLTRVSADVLSSVPPITRPLQFPPHSPGCPTISVLWWGIPTPVTSRE